MTHEDSGLQDQIIIRRRELTKNDKLGFVIEGKPLSALIATFAVITLISETLGPTNKLVPAELVTLKGLQTQIVHDRLPKDITFGIGIVYVSCDCCAVQMADDMTIGLYFLKSNYGIINMRGGILPLEGKMLICKSNIHEGSIALMCGFRGRYVFRPML
jgi:hypothetical protein